MGNCLTCLKSGDSNASAMMDHQVAPIGAQPSSVAAATTTTTITRNVTTANERAGGGGEWVFFPLLNCVL